MYAKSIVYGKNVEFYQFEESPRGFTRESRKLQSARRLQSVALLGETKVGQNDSLPRKRQDNARSASMAFRRLVSANLGESENPILASFTYAKVVTDSRVAHENFKSFTGLLRNKFGKSVRYIYVPEFQKRGAFHFHALFWGLPIELFREERRTRLVASLWGHGFVDLVLTDGHEKLATYLAKYMAKAFTDPRLSFQKAYVASRNVRRPVVWKKAMLTALEFEHDLSTAETLQDKIYETKWLGQCRHRWFLKAKI